MCLNGNFRSPALRREFAGSLIFVDPVDDRGVETATGGNFASLFHPLLSPISPMTVLRRRQSWEPEKTVSSTGKADAWKCDR